MKSLIKTICCLLLFIGCTQKYQTYHTIDKYSFDKNNPKTPITPKIYPGKKVVKKHCEGQVFFSRNAVTHTDRYLQNIVKTICPESDFLMNSRLTETWWTTIIYSRSCVELETFCPRIVKNHN